MCMELARPFDPFLVAVVEVISPLAPFVSLKKTIFVRKSQKFKAAKSEKAYSFPYQIFKDPTKKKRLSRFEQI